MWRFEAEQSFTEGLLRMFEASAEPWTADSQQLLAAGTNGRRKVSIEKERRTVRLCKRTDAAVPLLQVPPRFRERF